MTELAISYLSIDSVRVASRNARTHTQGTTIIAAEMTGRACHAIEINPAYCDVAVLRWQAFTGATATLAADGSAFADVAAERVPQPEPAAA